MATAIDNGMALWMWPLTMAKLSSDWMETMTSAAHVVDTRMPMIAAAWLSPLTANHTELSRMVSEKTDAFGRSGRSITAAQGSIRRASKANARALGKLSGGQFLGFSEWTGIFERNLEIAATLLAMPTNALAPVHGRATANSRRLGRS